MNSGLMSHQQEDHMETGPQFSLKSHLKEWGDRFCDSWIGGLMLSTTIPLLLCRDRRGVWKEMSCYDMLSVFTFFPFFKGNS